MVDDATLQAMVADELAWLPSVDAAHIGVSARNGVITLSGIVSTLAEKLTAEAAARRVKGVRGIAEEITVRPPSAHKDSDEEIAERALRMLSWDVEVPAEQIQIMVEKGVVTLTGTVARQFQKRAAEQDVRRLSGVVAILNMIEVRGSGGADQPGKVHEQIEAALRRSAEVEASHIAVTVSGGKVTLRGKVTNWWERNVAEDAAWSAPGVTEVDDQLVVTI